MNKYRILLYTIVMTMLCSSSCNSQPIRLFAGKYTQADEKGLYLFDLNREEGTFELLLEADAGPNPAYFCISEKKGLIYAANEVMNFNGTEGGGVTTLKYDAKTGKIEKINELTVPKGSPCFISLSAEQDFLFLANYTGGSITVVKLDDNGIPVNVTDNIFFEEVEGSVSHAHMIAIGPGGKRIYLTDLGLDRIVIYDFNSATGKLHQIQNGIVKLPKGSGPRHFVFNSDGTKMYVICEVNSTISVFNVDQIGEITLIQTISTLKDGFEGKNACADIHIGKNGKFLYGSNRGENSIVTFSIEARGTLSLAGHTSCGGNWPRNFVIDPSGKYILVGNQRSGNISVLKIDSKTGIPGDPENDYKLAAPACLKFLN